MKADSRSIKDWHDFWSATKSVVINKGNWVAHWWLRRFDADYQQQMVSELVVRLRDEARQTGASHNELDAIDRDFAAQKLGLPTTKSVLKGIKDSS